MSFQVVESNYTVGGGEFLFSHSFDQLTLLLQGLCLRSQLRGFQMDMENMLLTIQTSVEILSKHLAVPFITINHLTLSIDSLDELSKWSQKGDVPCTMKLPLSTYPCFGVFASQAVDTMGGTPKRSADIHLRIRNVQAASGLWQLSAAWRRCCTISPIVVSISC